MPAGTSTCPSPAGRTRSARSSTPLGDLQALRARGGAWPGSTRGSWPAWPSVDNAAEGRGKVTYADVTVTNVAEVVQGLRGGVNNGRGHDGMDHRRAGTASRNDHPQHPLLPDPGNPP